MKKFLLGIILVMAVLFASNQSFVKHTFAQWDSSWDNTNGDCLSCNQGVYCSDGYTWAIDYAHCPTDNNSGTQGVYCSDGYTWAIDYAHCPTTNNTQGVYCSDGYTWAIDYAHCPTDNNSGTQGVYCSDGYTWAIDYAHCPTITITPYTPPVYTPPVYNNTPSWQYPIYQQNSYFCQSTGQYVYNYSQCPVITTQPNMIQCWNGTWVYNQSQCPVQTQTCKDGSIISINQTCPTYYCPLNGSYYSTQSEYNAYCKQLTQTCPNGQVIPVNQLCPAQTHTCWNGVVLPVSQSCPSQYQTCWDGSVIPVTQACPVKTITTTIIKEVKIINHSVVTNIATKVSQTSAECNGVGLISNNTASLGWFEFGTTESLGKTTNSADIGNDSQSYFSNVITGLKPNTTYYCRAVMANRDGTYKGKIVSFKTLGATKKEKEIVYASPKKDSKTTKPKTKTEFVCSDGSIAVAKTVLIADTINSGGKLLSIKIERSAPDLVQGGTINYRISITNDSDSAVSGAETKIVLPSELVFLDATTTKGITVKDNVMTVPIGDINSKEVKTFILPAKVLNTAEVGKAVVTTVYASYNLPVTGSKVVKDEVSSYMTANIVSASDKNSSTSKSTSIASILFPQTLLGWLVLFAVILIIIVLIMNIRRWIAERKLEREEEIIHHHRS